MMTDTPANDATWVVIASYNEAEVISDVVSGVVRMGYRVVVVDDASTDNSAERASAAGAYVLQHFINLGQGAALQTGISFALTRGASIIVTFDGDGQHQPEDIPRLVTALAAAKAEFALGSRFLGVTENLSVGRRWVLKGATWFTRITTGLKLTDAHNGLRAMTRRAAATINLRQNRMAHASEFLHQVSASGLPYVEVPVRIVYTSYSLGKGQKLSGSLAILVDLFARSLHR